MRIFVVNLKRSSERREYMQKLLKDFPYPWEFFEAVDGKEIKNLSKVYSEKKAMHFYGKGLTQGEVGCALSHLAIYKKMVDENIDAALILEDDIIIEKDFLEVVAALRIKKTDNDIVLLGQSDEKAIKQVWGKKISTYQKLHRLLNYGYGAYAYIIDKRAAEKLYTLNFPVKVPSDFWNYFSRYVNIFVVEPNVISPIRGEDASSIDAMGSRWTYEKPAFKDEIKANQTIFNFLAIMLRKTCSFVKIMLLCIKNFFLSILPAQRIE